MDTSSGSAIIIIFMIMIFAGFAAVAASVFSKAKNANKHRPPFQPPDRYDPYGQNKPDDTKPQGYNPWQNQNKTDPWGPYANKPGNNWTDKPNEQPWQPRQTKAEADEAVKAEEKERIREEKERIQREREQQRRQRITEAAGDVRKHYQMPEKDQADISLRNGIGAARGFEEMAVPVTGNGDVESLSQPECGECGRAISADAPRQAGTRDGELEALEFEAGIERQNLAILQSNGAMETGRITKVESVSENYCRITFALQTFDGAFTKYAISKKDAKFMPDTAHYILLDKGDKDRCTVL